MSLDTGVAGSREGYPRLAAVATICSRSFTHEFPEEYRKYAFKDE